MRHAAGVVWAGLLICLLTAPPALARPERIRPGHSYYSDDSVAEGPVRDIAEERNFEEVYQRYRYYEAVYDEQERVVLWKEYRRGEVVRTETYRYSPDGALLERVVERPGRAPETTRFPAGVPSPREEATERGIVRP